MNDRIMNKIWKEGYTIYDTCYGDCEREIEKAKGCYESVLSYRVKSDTPNVKMFVILVK